MGCRCDETKISAPRSAPITGPRFVDCLDHIRIFPLALDRREVYLSNYPDPFTLLPAERYDMQRAARLAERGLTPDSADLIIDQAYAELKTFLLNWVGWFPPERGDALVKILTDRAAELAQEIYG